MDLLKVTKHALSNRLTHEWYFLYVIIAWVSSRINSTEHMTNTISCKLAIGLQFVLLTLSSLYILNSVRCVSNRPLARSFRFVDFLNSHSAGVFPVHTNRSNFMIATKTIQSDFCQLLYFFLRTFIFLRLHNFRLLVITHIGFDLNWFSANKNNWSEKFL